VHLSDGDDDGEGGAVSVPLYTIVKHRGACPAETGWYHWEPAVRMRNCISSDWDPNMVLTGDD